MTNRQGRHFRQATRMALWRVPIGLITRISPLFSKHLPDQNPRFGLLDPANASADALSAQATKFKPIYELTRNSCRQRLKTRQVWLKS
jgi:hypothetical protein